MVAELLLYNLVNSQDVLMSDLAFLAVHKVVFEPLNILVDSIGCCLNISGRSADITDLYINSGFKRVDSLIQAVNRLLCVRHILLPPVLKACNCIKHIGTLGISLFISLTPLSQFIQGLLQE